MVDKYQIYHKLPYFLQVIGASLHGYQLLNWRYGPDTEKFVEEALERDSWTLNQWEIWQEERLALILNHAATQVPYYREQWNFRRRQGDRASWEVLENWPVLKKTALREAPRSFLAEGCNPKQMYLEHTSGTTGTPLVLYQSKDTLHQWYALYEARVRRWNGVSRNDRWAIIGGQMVTSFSRSKPPFWVWNETFHQLYLSSYHISAENAQSYISAMRRYKVRYILSYPSSLTALADYVLQQKIPVPPLRAVISNAEPLFEFQRSTISSAFHAPVINTYGMSELVCGASECDQGSMHLWPEAGKVEIMDEDLDELTSGNSTGRIIATGLLNSEMPLIRYETGDRGALRKDTCKCGRKLPMINEIEGRIDDVIVTPDGRKIGRLDPIFKTDIPIHEAQIIQEDKNTIRVKFIPDQGYNHDPLLIKRLQEHLGEMDFILEKVESIPRGSNGKFKAVISNIQG